MEASFQSYVRQLSLRPGASEQSILDMSRCCSFRLPPDYLNFLRFSNGAIGIGPNLFVVIWSTEEAVESNRDYNTDDLAPGLFLIGSDGCGNLLGIDTRSGEPDEMSYVWFDSMDMDWDAITTRCSSFGALLDYLNRYYGKLPEVDV